MLSGISAQAQTITETFGSGANQFQIEFVTIGTPGNEADTTGNPRPVGRVDYVYNLGKYEISREMINMANSAGGLGISLADLSNHGGNGDLRPGTGISWLEAARFVNWLNLSTGASAAYKFDDNGNVQTWSSGEAGFQTSNPTRNSFAAYFLPTRDEWYKAAYGSPNGEWFNYPNGSDAKPAIVSGGTSGAVYGLDSPGSSPADIMAAGGPSLYGTVAQGGNAWEWMENIQAGGGHSAWIGEIRGGSWQTGGGVHDNLASLNYDAWDAGVELFDTGFRVAMVPEPSSLSLLLAGWAVLMTGRRRKQD